MSNQNKTETKEASRPSIVKQKSDKPPVLVVRRRDRFASVANTSAKRNAPVSIDDEYAPFSMNDDELLEFEMHPEGRGEFKVRPISKAWRHKGRKPAYRTAVCNASYIWRDGDAVDEYGKMPASFSQRGYELRARGLALPGSAPKWASERYRVWEEADANAAATGDNTAAPGWHVVGEIPTTISEHYWEWLLLGFIERELAGRGAVVAWAIHALQGDDGEWIVKPHFHLVVTLLYWRHRTGRFGKRHPNWLSNRKAHNRLQAAWYRRCGDARMIRRTEDGRRTPWMKP